MASYERYTEEENRKGLELNMGENEFGQSQRSCVWMINVLKQVKHEA